MSIELDALREWVPDLMDELVTLRAQNAMLKEKQFTQPEQEPDLWVVTNPWGVNEYLWSEPRKHIYKTYKVTKFYRLPPVNKHKIGVDDE